MSKQVCVDSVWRDVIFMEQDGEDYYFVVYKDGKNQAIRVHEKYIKDKPDEVKKIDWGKQLQIKSGEWCNVVFCKKYDNVISLIFEKEGEPVYIHENIDDLPLRGISVRNKPQSIIFERWIVYSKNGIAHVCSSEHQAEKQVLNLGNQYKVKHIKVEWEL